MVQLRVIGAVVLIAVVILAIYFVGVTKFGPGPTYPVNLTSSSSYTTAQTSIVKTTTVNVINESVVSIAPEVVIVSPENLSTVNGVVNITANVVDASGVKSVQFYIGKNLSWTSNTLPYHYLWNTTGLTSPDYVITVKAYDYSNQTGQADILVDIGLIQHGK